MTFLCSEGKNITSFSFSLQFAIIGQARYIDFFHLRCLKVSVSM